MQLFNLNVDPSEMNDLSMADEYQAKLAELQSLLANQRTLHDDPLLK